MVKSNKYGRSMIDIAWRMTFSSSEDPTITSTDEQIISDKNLRNERSSHARHKDKSIPKMFNNDKNLTEMTTNQRTQCSNKDKQENCLYSENWSCECIDESSYSFKSNHKSPDKSSPIDTFYQIVYECLTSKDQQNRISQSSNNQKSALTQCKSNTISSSVNDKCKNKKGSNLTVKNVQNCQEVNNRWSIPNIMSQTSILLLCAFVLLFGTSGVDAVTKDGKEDDELVESDKVQETVAAEQPVEVSTAAIVKKKPTEKEDEGLLTTIVDLIDDDDDDEVKDDGTKDEAVVTSEDTTSEEDEDEDEKDSTEKEEQDEAEKDDEDDDEEEDDDDDDDDDTDKIKEKPATETKKPEKGNKTKKEKDAISFASIGETLGLSRIFRAKAE